MPLVRISFLEGHPTNIGKQVGDIVYHTLVETINVPLKDNFQIISEHDRDSPIYYPEYLDIRRTEGIVAIQITLNDGRSVAAKKTFYTTLAGRLNRELGVRPEDIFINLVEVKKENWSICNGVAQYAE